MDCIYQLPPPFNNSKCISESTVCKENNKKFELIRVSDKNEKIRKITVDKCVYSETDKPRKCDYLFIRLKTSDYYFVELKGKKIEDAYIQIVTTINNLKQNNFIKQEQIHAFMVMSGLKKVANQKFNNLKEDFERRLKIGKFLSKATDYYEYRI